MVTWSVPPLFTGATVAVLATGPSLTPAAVAAVRALHAVAVSDAFRLAPHADILYSADFQWWQHPRNADAHRFAGLKVSCTPTPGVRMLQNAGVIGYSDAADCVHTLGNSGAQAIQVAAKAGASRILLLGFDMRGDHFFGRHPAGLENTSPELYARWLPRFAALARALHERGIEVLNCTPGSALDVFPRVAVRDAMEVPA